MPGASSLAWTTPMQRRTEPLRAKTQRPSALPTASGGCRHWPGDDQRHDPHDHRAEIRLRRHAGAARGNGHDAARAMNVPRKLPVILGPARATLVAVHLGLSVDAPPTRAWNRVRRRAATGRQALSRLPARRFLFARARRQRGSRSGWRTSEKLRNFGKKNAHLLVGTLSTTYQIW